MSEVEKFKELFKEDYKSEDQEIIAQKEAKEAFDNTMVFDIDLIKKLSHLEDNRHVDNEPKERGRPRKTNILPNRVKKHKLTFTLPKYQKEELIKQSKLSDRTLSDYIRHYIRGIKNLNTAVLIDREDISQENMKIVSITISISRDDVLKITKYCKEELNRKTADGIKHLLKHPRLIKTNILLQEKK